MLLMMVMVTIFVQCRKEALLPKTEDPDDPTRPAVVPEAAEVNTFVWSYMNYFYLWNDKVPNLSNPYYQMLTSTSTNYKRNKDSLNVFLNKYTDPTKLFNDLLYQYKVVDKWSFIVSDYAILENWIAGISKTMGCDFQLYYLNSTSADIIGIVRYVVKGSPAELAGVKRGDIFNKVDGVQLTDANYTANLINKESFTLTFSKMTDNVLTPTGKTATMTAVQLQEDPIHFSKILTVNGNNIGYLVYNGFTSDFDLQLNTLFQQFKTAGISKLILDLRYNGGGSVQTAIYLASMIYTTNSSKIFAKSVWNSNNTENNGSDSFTDKITTTTSTAPINSLNMADIYFIVSSESASASEMLINGLKPYMNVKVVGTNTVGKYVASTTIYDYARDSSGNLIPDGKGGYVKVSNHKYAMQPIIAKYANSLGVSDFVNGIAPDITAKEDAGNLLPFGDENETLLKAVLDNIKGLKSQSIDNPSGLANSKAIFGIKDKVRFSRDMYIDPRKLEKRTR